MSKLLYLKNLLSDRNVASITPTSSHGVERILGKMDFERARLIVEYGPGGGVFTKALLERMRPDAQLIAIEANPSFAERLRRDLAADPRLHVIEGSAEDVTTIVAERSQWNADYIISGIPFSLFPVETKNRILERTCEVLDAEGSFLVYQFFVSFSGPKNDIKRKLAEYLKVVHSEFEWLCVPPLRIYESKLKK